LAVAADKIKPGASSALIVVDVQNCFLPGGSLAVKEGDQVIPVINRIAKGFDNVVMTQDWHTPHHMSFASSYPDKKPFDAVKWRPSAVAGPLRAGHRRRTNRQGH
jgi:nicotinamidase/pyrazinamidase